MLIDRAGGTLGGFGRFALTLLAAWPLAVGCAAAEPPPASETLAPLLPSIQVYTAGDSVHFVLQVMNTTEAPVKVITYGTFDMLHEGHLRLLRRESRDASHGVVGLQLYHGPAGDTHRHQPFFEQWELIQQTPVDALASLVGGPHVVAKRLDDVVGSHAEMGDAGLHEP